MLKYIGKGTCIIGIPARDLHKFEIERYGGKEFLLGTGLYLDSEQKPKPKENRASLGGFENKVIGGDE